MIIVKNKAIFKPNSNKMKKIGNVLNARNDFKKNKNKNLNFLLKNRFNWMKKFIHKDDKGLEVGAGAGFSKLFIDHKNFFISDLAEYDHLDFKNIDAQRTGFENDSYDFVIAANMIHHVPYPIKFLNEMFRILKPGGRLIIQDAYSSVIFQLVTIIMKHEGFDFTKDVWDENVFMSDENDKWSGNIAVTNLIFDNVEKFNDKFGDKFSIHHQKFYECFIFLNSGGVSSKTIYIPLNNFFLKILNFVDTILIKFLPNIFAMGRQIVLKKK
ncbi:class I SAM-dependent methyltransferase [Candidatus Pelagibacter ubique]|nr:class I SAM-dependent methyltransferase [Candidatus Pelagibacter ubique]